MTDNPTQTGAVPSSNGEAGRHTGIPAIGLGTYGLRGAERGSPL